MSASSYDGLALPKPMGDKLTPAQDAAELERCHLRSSGRCEVRIRHRQGGGMKVTRCHNRATENHHLLGGNGVRGRGRSGTAEWRLDICSFCHGDIDGTVGGARLVPVDPQVDSSRIVYERRR